MTQEQRAAVGAIKQVLQEHAWVQWWPYEGNGNCGCDNDRVYKLGEYHAHIAERLVSELGLVLS